MLTDPIRGVLQLIVRRENHHCVGRVLVDGLDEVHAQIATPALLILVRKRYLNGLMPARLRVNLKEFVKGAAGLQLRKLLANFGHHYSQGYSSQKAVINGVDAALLRPKAHNFEHQLESLPVWHIVYNILAGDASQQTALAHIAQLLKLVDISQIVCLEQLMNVSWLIDAGKQNVELDGAAVHLYDWYFRLRDGLQSIKVFQGLDMLDEAHQELLLTNELRSKD